MELLDAKFKPWADKDMDSYVGVVLMLAGDLVKANYSHHKLVIVHSLWEEIESDEFIPLWMNWCKLRFDSDVEDNADAAYVFMVLTHDNDGVYRVLTSDASTQEAWVTKYISEHGTEVWETVPGSIHPGESTISVFKPKKGSKPSPSQLPPKRPKKLIKKRERV